MDRGVWAERKVGMKSLWAAAPSGGSRLLGRRWGAERGGRWLVGYSTSLSLSPEMSSLLFKGLFLIVCACRYRKGSVAQHPRGLCWKKNWEAAVFRVGPGTGPAAVPCPSVTSPAHAVMTSRPVPSCFISRGSRTRFVSRPSTTGKTEPVSVYVAAPGLKAVRLNQESPSSQRPSAWGSRGSQYMVSGKGRAPA